MKIQKEYVLSMFKEWYLKVNGIEVCAMDKDLLFVAAGNVKHCGWSEKELHQFFKDNYSGLSI